jgi:hypothetical protein
MLLVFAHATERDLWPHLIAQGTPHADVRVRHDVGELSARLAHLTGDRKVAREWVQFLATLARDAPDHGIAARATAVQHMLQATETGPVTGR